MKKFLFTLAALFMAGTAMADSGFFFGTLDESTIGSTNESSLVLTQEDLQLEEYEMYLGAYWSARVSGTECEITFPEGMTITFAEPGADATINTLNARGRAATETAAYAGLVEPYDHFVTTFNASGYYKDEDGNIVNYGVNKWEAGLYEEMAIFYVVFDPNFQGGDIIVKTTVASGKDVRGGTVQENGEHAKAFTFTCHVTVEGGVTPDPVVAPEPTLTWNEETFTMEATCEGHEVVLMIGDEVVENPYTVEQTEEEQTIVFSAYTVAAEGEDENSAAVEQEVVVPAKPAPVQTDAPEITVVDDADAQTVTVTATGNGHICLYNDDVLVAEGEGVAEYVIAYGEDPEGEEYGFSATAQVEGELVSEYALATVFVPGKPAPVQTDKPVINYAVDEEAQTVTVTATGNGHICLYNDDVLVAEGEGVAEYVVNFTEDPEGEEMGFSATAQVEGELVSEYALATVFVPGKPVVPEVTEAPVINFEVNAEEEYVMISATGNGTVKLYIDGMPVSNPFMYRFQDEEQEIVVTATAQEEGKEISETVEEVYVVPAKTVVPPEPVQTAAPVISTFVDMDAETVTITATGDGHICLYNDDVLVAEGEGVAEYVVPFTEDPEGEEMGFSATAQVEGELVSEYALATVEIPGKTPEPYQTPAPVVETELTDEALVITVTGEGTVKLFVQYINNETGEMTTEEYTGEGTVVVPVARGTEETYINYWAVAQANDEAVPAITETEYYVVVPAQEVTPEDPHAKGWWIVLTDINGEEVWYELHEGTDGSWVTTVTLNYGDYGTFYWDPALSAAENNLNRPNVPYHFVVDGQVWGAPEADQATLMGEAANTMSNPLYENANNYTVPVGYSYVLGIYVDPSETDQLGDGTFYYVYCAQGPQTDVDELNAAKTVAGVRYFNLAGQEMQEANGMTIVVTTYTDGTTSAVKVMK